MENILEKKELTLKKMKMETFDDSSKIAVNYKF